MNLKLGGLKVLVIDKIAEVLGDKTASNILNLVDDLYWEIDRMSADGKETLNNLSDLLENEV
mgnify:CR=1 FL=1